MSLRDVSVAVNKSRELSFIHLVLALTEMLTNLRTDFRPQSNLQVNINSAAAALDKLHRRGTVLDHVTYRADSSLRQRGARVDLVIAT